MLQAVLPKWWARYRLRREHRREFEFTGADQVRLRVENSVYMEQDKLQNARDWLYRRETRYPRLAVMTSTAAVIATVASVSVAYYNAENTRRADRAWLGPASMRLSERPTFGKDLEFLFEYENAGRQPALNVSYYLDSYTSREREVGSGPRPLGHILRCRHVPPPRNIRLVVFPGKGAFEPYRAADSLLRDPFGGEIILVNGCMVYQTLNEIHRTAFCFKYDPRHERRDAYGKPILDLCNHGHYAD